MAHKRILVIDDDSTVIEAVGAALSPPYGVAGAANGASALAFLETERTDLVILDLALGPEDGVALMPLLRRRTPAPILVLTAFATRENLLRLMEARPEGIMEKPVSVQPLRARVAAVLDLTPPEADTLERVRAWIAAECHRQLTIKEIAHAANMSPAHLRRIFRKRFGLSPGGFLEHCRMQRAAALLRDTTISLKELGPQVGFRSASSLSTAFKRVLGSTPKAFRNEEHPPVPKKTEQHWDD